MTKLLYYTDSYLRSFQAEVIEVITEKTAVVLNQTLFYPSGGGQPSDSGKLMFSQKSVEVTKVKRANGKILHFLEGELPSEGEDVTGNIDWERRYNLMRTHTAMHALSAIAWRDFQAQVTGGNMDELQGRLDFEFNDFNAELVQEIEKRVNIELQKGLEVSSRILPRAEAETIPDLIRTKINLLPAALTEIRIVEIAGLDLQADGGTHVRNTSEVGTVKITGYKSKGRINKRIKFAIE